MNAVERRQMWESNTPGVREDKRMSESEANGPARAVPMVAEANVFALHPEGYKAHFKLTFPEAGGIGIGINNLDRLIETLVNKGYKPDGTPMQHGNAPAAEKPARGRESRSRGGAPECVDCGGPCWDNRENKRNPKAPDFKCKDKDCCAAAWLTKDGELRWAD